MASGDETLKRVYHLGSTGDLTSITSLIDGVTTGHTYTVLSVSLNNNSSSVDATFDMGVWIGGTGANVIIIYDDQSLPAKATFIHNDKIVLAAGDDLFFQTPTDWDIDIYVSYLDQEL